MELLTLLDGGANIATIGICFYLFGLKKDHEHLKQNFLDFKKEVKNNG